MTSSMTHCGSDSHEIFSAGTGLTEKARRGGKPASLFISSEEKIALGEREDLSRFAGKDFTVGFHDVGLRVDLYLR